MKTKMKTKCLTCSSCCQQGVWVDLEEAKKIVQLDLWGDFFHMVIDKDFPSGYALSTSINNTPCSFLTKSGMCSIHRIDYKLKPSYCKKFPRGDKTNKNAIKAICKMI